MSQAPAACATDVSASALHGSADFAEALGCAILARVVERQRGSAKSNDLDGEVIPLVVFVYFRSTSAGRQRGEGKSLSTNSPLRSSCLHGGVVLG
jgi:hypothetical protein